jgi:hypothetical protein
LRFYAARFFLSSLFNFRLNSLFQTTPAPVGAVRQRASPHLEMTALCDRSLRAGSPALLFENPTGHHMPVLARNKVIMCWLPQRGGAFDFRELPAGGGADQEVPPRPRPARDVWHLEFSAPVHVLPKFIVVVDDDINIRDWKDVIWAITTRVDPTRDTLLADSTPIDYLDFASPVSGLGSKMGLDSTGCCVDRLDGRYRLRKAGADLVYHCAKQHSEPTGDKRAGKVDELVLTPLELINRIAALMPPRGTHRHRYFGVLAPNSPSASRRTTCGRC